MKSNNENPFRTKSRVERTPDISAIKRRKSVKSALPVRSVVENQVDTCQIDDTSFTSASPRQALFTEPRLSTFNIFKGFALCHEEVAADEEDNLVGTANDNFRQTKSEPLAKSEKSMVTEDVDDVPNSIIEATESSNHDAMDDSTSDNDLNSVESELNQLNIDEVLQAFRDDAEAAEKAIEMATICGRLHPKEFREYLRAFRSPNGKQSDDQIMKEELEWNYTRTQSALILPGVEGASLPTVYRPDSLVFASPTSSLLNMLEMADTPIEGAPARDNLACSPILMSVECTPIPEVDDVWGIPVPKQEEETMKGEASRHHSLKDRTESTRLAVAAAVASVSNFPFATSTPSYPDSTTGMQTTQSGNAIVPLAPKMVRISLFVPSIAEQLRMSETPTAQIPGKEEEAFLPRKVMMRTPPKFPEDTVLKAVLINETEVAAAEEKREELLEGPGVDDSMLQECNTLDIEEPEGEDDRLAVLSANMSLLNDSIRNTSQYTGGLPEWSATELDRVSRVIKRVSVGAADCPNTHSIMRQLQVEIARLTKEVSDQHSELAAVVADKRALESRLEEVCGAITKRLCECLTSFPIVLYCIEFN